MFTKRVLVLLLITMVCVTSGCHNLRKKFIRKKKQKKEIAVYVDFKDYPEKPSREAYINYYLFVRGWIDDLAEALKQGVSYKRQRRAINEAIMNLEQIITFYSTEGKDAVYPIYEGLQDLRAEMVKSPNMSEAKSNLFVRKVEQLKRRFEKDFNYSDVEKWMN